MTGEGATLGPALGPRRRIFRRRRNWWPLVTALSLVVAMTSTRYF